MSTSTRPATPAPTAQPARSKQSVMLTLFIVLCLCIISVFAVYMATSQGDPGERADKEFRKQLGHSLGIAGFDAVATASNGVCVIEYQEPLPREIADSIARMSAGIYSQVRRRHGSEPSVTVEVFVRGNKVAEAASESGDVDWRGELQKLGEVARQAEKQATSPR